MKKILAYLTICILFITSASSIAYASEAEDNITVPISASYTKGVFSFIISENANLGLNTTVDTSKDSLEAEFIGKVEETKLDLGSDVIVTAILNPFDYKIVEPIIKTVLNEDDKQEKIAFDITLVKQIGEESIEIPEINDAIRFRVKAPSDLDPDKVSDAKILGVHKRADGIVNVTIIPVTYDKTSDTFTFEIKDFSNFVLSYDKKANSEMKPTEEKKEGEQEKPKSEEKKSDQPKSESLVTPQAEPAQTRPGDFSGSSPQSQATPAPSQQTVSTPTTPQAQATVSHIGFQTSDSMAIFIAIGIAIIGIVILIILIIARSKTKRE